MTFSDAIDEGAFKDWSISEGNFSESVGPTIFPLSWIINIIWNDVVGW